MATLILLNGSNLVHRGDNLVRRGPYRLRSLEWFTALWYLATTDGNIAAGVPKIEGWPRRESERFSHQRRIRLFLYATHDSHDYHDYHDYRDYHDCHYELLTYESKRGQGNRSLGMSEHLPLEDTIRARHHPFDIQ
ncbi:hypothetical protein N7532_004351 [Penicillium argentinense]|uniref:Uncharacterized protein n=1 Tax=Penicillium argentinense TaxID=1131581 RepID=A0A9W9FPT3_9EURO|nr:uncharacterized protein N7532_004351 [Penicillium argentinense]KAJ5103822.1 hypothetical protein N7532_004351 [Penicillium argentinense]